MAELYRIPYEVHLFVPRRVDRVLNSPLEYCAAYHDHFKHDMCFPLFLLPMEILTHFNIVPNTIRVVVGFYCFYQDKCVVSFLALFRSLFMLKTSTMSGRYQFSCRPKHNLKIMLPIKNIKWKDFFVFFKIHTGVILPPMWRSNKVSDSVSYLGFPKVYHMVNLTDIVKGDLPKEFIPNYAEAP